MARSNFEVLIDSDAFVASALPDDLLHAEATAMFQKLEKQETSAAMTNWTLAETATVLSYRVNQGLARRFLDRIDRSRLPIIQVNEELQSNAFALFRAQEGRGVSMVDCVNAVVAQHLDIPRIFSFDKFYKRLNLATVG